MPPEQQQIQLPLIWAGEVGIMVPTLTYINAGDSNNVEVGFIGGGSITLNAQQSFALLAAMGRTRVQPPSTGAVSPFK